MAIIVSGSRRELVIVEGEVEDLFACPCCCGYKTLTQLGWDICKVLNYK